MSKMFKVDNKVVQTWNPISGCEHYCYYCFAKKLVDDKLKNTPKYQNGFKPTIHQHTLHQSLGKNKTYFVCDMGDMWGNFINDEWIWRVLTKCKESHNTNTFMFLTKNPGRYIDYFDKHPEDYKSNFILGATIESNLSFPDSKIMSVAPDVFDRYIAMKKLDKHYRKFISIEPIMSFSQDILSQWIKDISPEFVYVGFDNHNSELPEPSKEDTFNLIDILKQFTEVRLKTMK